MSAKHVLLFCVCFCFNWCSSQKSSVYKLIYHDFAEQNYDKCVRLLNGTHQIGCQSSNAGNVGVLYHINSTATTQEFLKNAFRKAYVPFVDATIFRRKIVMDFKASGKVQGVIVYEPDNFNTSVDWSPEPSCPDDNFGLYNSTYGSDYANCKKGSWNPTGDGLSDVDIPFPIFYLLKSEDRDAILKCYQDHNVDEQYPLCAVQMKSRMFGAVDSPTCIRRSNWQTSLTPDAFCDPMGGFNIVSSLQKLDASYSKGLDSTIMVTAPIDSRSFMSSFTAPGGNLATSFITLLATSQAIGKLSNKEKKELQKNIMFVVFDGEAFNNIGSNRMLYDMEQGTFPLASNKTFSMSMGNVSSIVEFRQLGLVSDQLFVHYDPVSYRTYKTQIDSMIGELQSVATNISVTSQSNNVGLSPSSLQTVLKKHQLPGIVLTDYQKTFENKRYFSRYDTLKNLKVTFGENATDAEVLEALQPLAKKLSDVATMSAKMLVRLANGNASVPSSVVADQNLTAQLLFCYLYKASCSLFNKTMPAKLASSNKLPNEPLPRYTSVYSGQFTKLTAITAYLLGRFTGEQMDAVNQSQCDSLSQGEYVKSFFFNGPVFSSTHQYRSCARASVFNLSAVAVPLIQNDFPSGITEQIALWTESRWSKTSFKFTMFLQQNQVDQGMTMLAGCIVLLCSFTSVYFINLKANVLFNGVPPI